MSKNKPKKVTQYSKVVTKTTITKEVVSSKHTKSVVVQEPTGKQPFTNRTKSRAKYDKLKTSARR